jgi:hypothetical protein
MPDNAVAIAPFAHRAGCCGRSHASLERPSALCDLDADVSQGSRIAAGLKLAVYHWVRLEVQAPESEKLGSCATRMKNETLGDVDHAEI